MSKDIAQQLALAADRLKGQLLVYQFNTLCDDHVLMSSEIHRRNSFWYEFIMLLFIYLCVKTIKMLKFNKFSCYRKPIGNIIQSIICEIIYH